MRFGEIVRPDLQVVRGLALRHLNNLESIVDSVLFAPAKEDLVQAITWLRLLDKSILGESLSMAELRMVLAACRDLEGIRPCNCQSGDARIDCEEGSIQCG